MRTGHKHIARGRRAFFDHEVGVVIGDRIVVHRNDVEGDRVGGLVGVLPTVRNPAVIHHLEGEAGITGPAFVRVGVNASALNWSAGMTWPSVTGNPLNHKVPFAGLVVMMIAAKAFPSVSLNPKSAGVKT